MVDTRKILMSLWFQFFGNCLQQPRGTQTEFEETKLKWILWYSLLDNPVIKIGKKELKLPSSR